MTVPLLYLAVSLVGALFTLNAIRPLRFEPTSLIAFAAGWWTSELPVHHIVWQAVATAGFIAFGALSAPPGWIGVAITALSWTGLVTLVVSAQRADGVLEDALVEALGPDYRSGLDPRLTERHTAVKTWRRLVVPWRFRDPDVEKVKDVAYVEDGRRVHRLDVYRNRAHPTGCPVLVYVHGGGWVMGDKREQGIPMMLHLAAHGWVCVTVNYRLSPKATFPDHLVDVKQAIAWVRQHAADYGGDPTFVAVSGGSAGGHLAALAALTANAPEYQPGFEEVDTAVQAAVPIYGVYDFLNRFHLRGRGMGWFLQRRVMKVSPAADREAWEKASPIDQIRGRVPPFFVVHGANDSLVPVAEARHFVARLREVSEEPVAYGELPGAQHAFEVFRSIRTAHAVDAIARFLAAVSARTRSR